MKERNLVMKIIAVLIAVATLCVMATEQIISWRVTLIAGYGIGSIVWLCIFLFDPCRFVIIHTAHNPLTSITRPAVWYRLTQIGLSLLWPFGFLLEVLCARYPALREKAYEY